MLSDKNMPPQAWQMLGIVLNLTKSYIFSPCLSNSTATELIQFLSDDSILFVTVARPSSSHAFAFLMLCLLWRLNKLSSGKLFPKKQHCIVAKI